MHKLISFTFLVAATSLHAQSWMDSTRLAMEQQDTSSWRQALVAWQGEDPTNPDLAASWFNYYFLKADREVLQLSLDLPDNQDALVITDSSGPVGSFTNGHVYNQELLNQGYAWIDRALAIYPTRLDLWFGKIYVIGLTEDWETFTNTILLAIRQGAKTNHQWTWSLNEPVEDGESFFLASLQDYQVDLFNTQDTSLLANMNSIATEVLKHHPNHVESMTNIGLGYLIANDLTTAEAWLLKASAIAPNDEVVQANLAYTYRLQGKLDLAKKYYEKLANSDNPDYQAFGKEQLESLNE